MKLVIAGFFSLTLAVIAPARATEIDGPERFCGYSPIVDLLAGERITTLDGGIHSGSFRWEGAFGALEVLGVGWASRPKGRIVKPYSAANPARFAQRRTDGTYKIAIWNGAKGAAYFKSPKPFTARQIDAIDRVSLFEEGDSPSGCKLRTIVVWDIICAAGTQQDQCADAGIASVHADHRGGNISVQTRNDRLECGNVSPPSCT